MPSVRQRTRCVNFLPPRAGAGEDRRHGQADNRVEHAGGRRYAARPTVWLGCRYQRHAALRTTARRVAHDLRVHRAGVAGAARSRDSARRRGYRVAMIGRTRPVPMVHVWNHVWLLVKWPHGFGTSMGHAWTFVAEGWCGLTCDVSQGCSDCERIQLPQSFHYLLLISCVALTIGSSGWAAHSVQPASYQRTFE